MGGEEEKEEEEGEGLVAVMLKYNFPASREILVVVGGGSRWAAAAAAACSGCRLLLMNYSGSPRGEWGGSQAAEN